MPAAGLEHQSAFELAVGTGDGVGGHAEVGRQRPHHRELVPGSQGAGADVAGQLCPHLLVGRGGGEQVVQDDGGVAVAELDPPPPAQLGVHGERVDRLTAGVQVLHDAEHLAVRRPVELLRAQLG